MTSKSTKPKLLLISALAPWPTASGGAVRVLETLESLSKHYAIYFLCALDQNQDPKPIYDHIKNFCTEFLTFQKQPQKSHFSFFSRGVPYWFSEWFNPELKLIIKNLVAQHQFSLVQIETSQLLYAAAALPKNVLTICTAYDVQLVSFWRRLAETKSWLVWIAKLGLLLQVWFYEERLLSKFNRVVAVSDVDQQFLTQLYGLTNTLVVPNGYHQPTDLKKKSLARFSIGFIGSTTHTPNRAALEYLIHRIAPELQQKIGEFDVVLAGNTSTLDQSMMLQQKGFTIQQLGFVDTVADFYQQINVLVAPLFSGSGTRIKILESLAHGVPVVTTAIGAEGLRVEKTESGILLASSPKDFVSQLMKIKQNPQVFKTETMAISQTWQAIFDDYQIKLAEHTNKNQTPA